MASATLSEEIRTMAASVCPIFDEKSGFIGIWALNRNFSPSLGTLGELMSLAEPTLQALTTLPQRRIPNDATEVGNGVRFEGGVFVMVKEARAPNEDLAHPESDIAYVLFDHYGIASLKRGKRSDLRITTPPPRAATAPQDQAGPGRSTTDWFKGASRRGGPNTPSDFNLFEIPRYSLQEWAHQVSQDPRRVQCTVLSIANVGSVTQALFDAIKDDHGLTSADAVKVFDEYLGAACPKCFGGLTGSLLQMVSASSKTAAVVGGGAQFQRILGGRCANCESDTYYIVWHGDRSDQAKSGGDKAAVRKNRPTASPKKWWRFWE
jgi:hypothetical protein